MVPPILILLVSTLFLVRFLNQCLEPEDRVLFVSVLAAFVGADHSLSGWEVDCPHPGFHLIHILAALAAASEGIKYHLFGIKDVGSYGFTEMEVNKPVFFAYDLDGKGFGRPTEQSRYIRISPHHCKSEPNEMFLRSTQEMSQAGSHHNGLADSPTI